MLVEDISRGQGGKRHCNSLQRRCKHCKVEHSLDTMYNVASIKESNYTNASVQLKVRHSSMFES